jgi:transcription elongation factor Elf1
MKCPRCDRKAVVLARSRPKPNVYRAYFRCPGCGKFKRERLQKIVFFGNDVVSESRNP